MERSDVQIGLKKLMQQNNLIEVTQNATDIIC